MSIRKFLGVAAAAIATMGAFSAAHAETSVSGNIALTTDYVFRGVSQSDGDPAVQGGFDLSHGLFYAGVWASSIDFGADGTLELDGYFGVKPTLGPVALDFGAIYYSYPGIDDSAEANMWEFKAAASYAPIEPLTLGAALYYSPDFTFSDDANAIYLEVNAAYTINDIFSVSGAVGHQDVDSAGYFADLSDDTDNYTTWNLGVAATYWGVTADLRYHGSDFDGVELFGPSGEVSNDDIVSLTFKRSL